MRNEVMKLGVPVERIRIINFGIDTSHFSKGPQNTEIRQKYGLSSGPAVISLRNLEPVYDVATLIKSVPRVLATVPDTRFIIVGKGSLEDELKSLAAQLGVYHAVNFVGFIPNEQLPVILSNVEVYVSTSLLDAGIAASTAEAMACELPVVVTDSGENSRWINSEENGVLVPVSQPEILAERLIQLLQNAELRHELGQRGRATICENNDYSVEMGKMEALYQEIGVQQ
jgi:glycosyltransferase involved in cell wall biosynthesis